MTKLEIQALCGQLDRGEVSYPLFIERCTRAIGSAIGCSRSGIWLFDEAGGRNVLRCLGIYDSVKDRMVLAPDELKDSVQAYFRALQADGHVIASHAPTHPATRGFFADRLGQSGVQSLLATAFSVNGKVFGAFTCTQIGAVSHWTPSQVSILKRIAGRLSLALVGASATRSPTLPMPL